MRRLDNTPIQIGSLLVCLLMGLASPALFALQQADCAAAMAGQKAYRLLSYNVENLFMRVGPQERTSATGFQPRDAGDRLRPQYKSPQQIARVAAIIKEQNPDIMVLTEVEDNAADRFNSEYLNGEYEVNCVRGNDPRGIEIAILVRKSLGFQTEYRSNKSLTWKDPAEGGRVNPLFARDFPILLLRKPGAAVPSLIIAGQHAKSKRDRPGDPESNIWRAEEYKAKAKIVGDLKTEFPGVPIVTAGDFNTEVRAATGNQGPELKPLVSIMQDAFDVADKTLPAAGRITHSFFPRDGAVQRSQMDTFMVSLPGSAHVLSTDVIAYHDADGRNFPWPRTYDERSKQPSDHNPIMMVLQIP
jgi:endonuclease/exonuclease/phosphatase family metal-dependent hydrolase